jgi:GH15 family glucan-1,4-alpha-glucosidase
MNIFDNSVNVILKNQSEYGSFIASPAFDTYHYSWIRDGSYIAYSLDVTGHYKETEKFCDWVDEVVKRYAHKVDTISDKLEKGEPLAKADFLNARYTLEGYDEKEEGWGNFQLDAYGTWLWLIAEHIRLTGNKSLLIKYKDSIDLITRYICSVWYYPNYDIWEENGDKYHTSTLACLYGGLNALNFYLKDTALQQTAYTIRAYILTNCVSDDHFVKYVGSSDVDASLLWLAVPFHVVEINNPLFIETVNHIKKDLYTEGGVFRYAKDTYYGGGEWILLSCWLGWYDVLAEDYEHANHIVQWVESMADDQGNLPEQVFTHMVDSSYYDEWVERWGEPASPLLWSHAMYIILKCALA